MKRKVKKDQAEEVMLATRVDPATARAFDRICEKNERTVAGQLRLMIRKLIEEGDSHDLSDAN
jgi:hypothetical protein